MKDKFELILRHYQEHEADTGNLISKKDADIKTEIVLQDQPTLKENNFDELFASLMNTYKEIVGPEKKISEIISGCKDDAKKTLDEVTEISSDEAKEDFCEACQITPTNKGEE